jgi:hypothetical protein
VNHRHPAINFFFSPKILDNFQFAKPFQHVKLKFELGSMAQAYNPSYSGGRDLEASLHKKFESPHLSINGWAKWQAPVTPRYTKKNK